MNLHSTMYLLNLEAHYQRLQASHYLHSTMYLLNRYISKITNDEYKFTFHYVSIKSKKNVIPAIRLYNLHSTMYLLNRPKSL